MPEPITAKQQLATRFELSLREDPGFNGKIITELPEGTVGQVLKGPKEVDGFGSYLIVTDAAEKGWFCASIMHTLHLDR